MAPILCAIGIAQLTRDGGMAAYGWFVLSAFCVLMAVLTLEYAERHLPVQTLQVKKIKGSDKEVLAFLIAYLLPLLAKDTFDFAKNMFVTCYIFFVILLTVYHSDAYDFNPLLGMFGYHFYEVETDDGMPFLIIARQPLGKPQQHLKLVQVSNSIFLHWERHKK